VTIIYNSNIHAREFMVLCFDCPPEFKKIVEDLLDAGHLRQCARLISTAIQNDIVRYTGLRYDDDSLEHVTRRKIRTKRASRSRLKAGGSAPRRSAVGEIPPLFRLADLPNEPHPIAPEPQATTQSGAVVPPDGWLFGQWNKMLPAKATSRALAHLSSDFPAGIPLDQVLRLVATAAWELGDVLSERDRYWLRDRDECLATAFPVSGPKGASARDRYAKHFVGNLNGRGELSGLPCGLNLVGLIEEGNLALTSAGWKFAAMTNPALDGDANRPADKLSTEEIEFLLSHISSNVPAEDSAYQTVLSAIAAGANTPVTLDQVLQDFVAQGQWRSLSPAFLSSQRSGVISRMIDLRLVRRDRDSVKVSYVATETGTDFLARGSIRAHSHSVHP
jgi:hypothetical protein